MNWLVLHGHASDSVLVRIDLFWLSEWLICLGQVQGFVFVRADPFRPKGVHFPEAFMRIMGCSGDRLRVRVGKGVTGRWLIGWLGHRIESIEKMSGNSYETSLGLGAELTFDVAKMLGFNFGAFGG